MGRELDRDVTVRFFEVTNKANGEPLADILERIYAKKLSERERDVGNGLRLMLETLDTSHPDLWLGDLTRVQRDNLPGHFTDNGTEPLPVEKLSHNIAFCYDKKANAMALQYNSMAREGKVLSYFSEFSKNSQYSYLPILSEDAMVKIHKKNINSFTVRLSRMRDFSKTQIEKGDFESALEEMANLFEGTSIAVKISTKSHKTPLDKDGVIDTVRRLMRLKEATKSVKKIQASTFEDADPYNFIAQLLKEKSTLDLPNNSPDESRSVRFGFVKQSYEKHQQHIRAALGVS